MKAVISKLSGMLKSGKISSSELAEKYIDAVKRDNAKYNAYVNETFDEARKSAKEADARLARGEGGPLCGMPYALKDNICTDGIETTCCSNILRGFRPYYSATVHEKLSACGAVLLGKTNMDEFAMGSTSETSCYGAPLNPRDSSRVTGGSSGGSAAAVAANLAPFALGSDTGGSIRQPACFCGVVGFKPTYGAVSRYGLIAYASSLDQIGPLASSVSDAAIVYDAIKGKDPKDMSSEEVSLSATSLSGDVKGLKIGMVKEYFDCLNPEMAARIEEVARLYEKAGAKIVSLGMPTLSRALPAYYIIACAEASSNLGRYDGIRYGVRCKNYSDADELMTRTRSEGFGKEVQKRIMLGTYVLSAGYYDAYYKKACAVRARVREEFDAVFGACDVLFAPVSPTSAFELGYAQRNVIETYQSDLYTVPVNIAGLPSISVPCGKDKKGLPIGMQIIGDRFADEKVLSAAYFLEQNEAFCEDDEEGGVAL
ncbi:MAG: Asp-tRNA(Asn)/Glu-tRNA(Gln) amidotransferase subunit GatA [Clostridia bacterium]|nr:Asp-tRNA(Asn)/Glu-tRNA(Gln) amidotransferase subunit GatA [Clostridia bacterium]